LKTHLNVSYYIAKNNKPFYGLHWVARTEWKIRGTNASWI
jgi:hypothetical protein